jgi:hypothetical protein
MNLNNILDLIDFEKRSECDLEVVKFTLWCFECIFEKFAKMVISGSREYSA